MAYSGETLRVIHLGGAQGVLAVRDYRGRGAAVDLPLRAIMADALRLGTQALVVAHDHPSGDPTPSRADRDATALLARVSRALGIRLHDHLIFGGGRHVSFRALGLL